MAEVPVMDKRWGALMALFALGAIPCFLFLESPLSLMLGIPLLLGAGAASQKAMPRPR